MENYLKFINYNKITGEILSVETRPYGFPPETNEIGYLFFPLATREIYKTHYVLDNVISERPQLSYMDTLTLKVDDFYIFEGIPSNTKIIIKDLITETITDGVFEISFPIQGDFELQLIPPFPYIAKDIKIIVEDK